MRIVLRGLGKDLEMIDVIVGCVGAALIVFLFVTVLRPEWF